MSKTINCECGEVVRAGNDDELVQKVERHVGEAHPELVGKMSRDDILAMAVEPGYDANKFGATPPAKQRNRAVTDYYEPGSTFKVVTVAGALSSHLVTPQTAFTLPYSLRVADRTVHDAEKRGTVRYTVAQILSHSSNIGAITLAEMLGKQRLSDWIYRFGFGKQTGIDFPGESPGAVLPAAQWSGSTIGNVPIGQGIAVTPIQMASAYAAIACARCWNGPACA